MTRLSGASTLRCHGRAGRFREQSHRVKTPLMWFMKAGNAQPALVCEHGLGFGCGKSTPWSPPWSSQAFGCTAATTIAWLPGPELPSAPNFIMLFNRLSAVVATGAFLCHSWQCSRARLGLIYGPRASNDRGLGKVFGNWNWPGLFFPSWLLRHRAEALHEIPTDDINLNLADRGRSKTTCVTRFLEEAGIADTSIINS